MGFSRITRLIVALSLFAGLLMGCAKSSEDVEVFLPRIEDPHAAQKAALCSPEKVSLASFDQNQKFLETAEFRSFFDCANYDGKFAGIAPLVHSPVSTRFLENLMDSVGSIAASEASKSIRDRLAPWFQEYRGKGVSKVDHMLPVVAKIIKHSAFRKAFPLIASLADQGKGVWHTLLPSMAKLVYDPRYPNLWQDLRKLFNVKSTTTEQNHLAITTREFFRFLRAENEDQNGVRKTNAMLLLELLDELQGFKVPETGLISLWEYMHNLDIWTTLYQEAGGAMRGEESLPDLNGGKGAGAEAIEASKNRKVAQLFQGGAKSAPILELIAIVDDFNKPRPEFLQQIADWMREPANQKRMNAGLVEFVAKRLVGEILNTMQVSKYFDGYVRRVLKKKIPVVVAAEEGGTKADVCAEGMDCQLSGAEFAEFLRGAFAHKEFETWLAKFVNDANKKKFREQNAQLLEKHGGLLRDLLAFYRSDAVAAYGAAIVAAAEGQKLALSAGIENFSQYYVLEKGATAGGFTGLSLEFDGKKQHAFNHLIDIWLKNSGDAWGESVVLQDAFRIVHTFMEEFAKDLKNDPSAPTLAQFFFRSTYSDPGLMEKLVVEAGTLGLRKNLDEKIEWLKDEIGPEIFKEESDLAAFRRVATQIPTLILYVESGMLRSGNNLTRALSSRDDGYLIRTYVNFISRAVKLGTANKFIPVWKDFTDFMDVRERRVKKAAADALTKMTPEEKVREKYRESRRQSDGTEALKKIGRALFRPRAGFETNWDTSLLGEIVVATRGLVSAERRAETEEWVLTIADRTLTAEDKDIDAFYDFFTGDESGIVLTGLETEADVKADYEFRKNVSDLIAHKQFPDVLVDLDRLFQDKAVVPALDFLAEKIDQGDIARLLELARKLLRVEGMPK